MGLIVNIYGRHPSIEAAVPLPCDLSININNTPMPCDWLCFGDDDVLPRLATHTWPKPRIGLIGPASYEFVNPAPECGRFITWQSLQKPFPSRKSSIHALLAAIRFGATEIRTWGVRMEGPRDYDGSDAANNPLHGHEARWTKEHAAWNRMLEEHAYLPLRVTRY